MPTPTYEPTRGEDLDGSTDEGRHSRCGAPKRATCSPHITVHLSACLSIISACHTQHAHARTHEVGSHSHMRAHARERTSVEPHLVATLCFCLVLVALREVLDGVARRLALRRELLRAGQGQWA